MSLSLKNPYLDIAVRPECGGRIDQITDRLRRKTWLWHPSGYDPGAARDLPDGASFDACWQGGFEEMFPNDAACTVDTYTLPDHGEAWSTAWTVQHASSQSLTLSMVCQAMPLRLEKRLVLEPDAPVLHVRYTLTNFGPEALPCMLKLHPALAIEEADEIELPDCNVEPVALEFSRIAGREGPTQWPLVENADGASVRLDRTQPATSGLREFIYCSALSDGRCGVRNPRTGSYFQLIFERSDFPFVWVLQSYGGFLGHYVLLLEPCTGKPYDLRDAIAEDTALWIPAQSTRALDVSVRVD